MVPFPANELEEAQRALVEEFALFADWQEKYAHLIELGRALPRMDPALKTEDRQVRGCQAQVWLAARREGDRIHFTAESDALIVQGLVALLLRVYSGRTPEQILAARDDFLREIGLDRHLSQNRANGLASLAREIRRHAAAGGGA
jgi:cysteine desulfuration protein SufE